jgi:hypothetical protein
MKFFATATLAALVFVSHGLKITSGTGHDQALPN